MWNTFGADVLVAVIGAALTVSIAFLTYLGRIRLEEHRALQILINDLHGRRALAVGRGSKVRFASWSASFKRANASIISARDEIKATRAKVRKHEKVQGPLVEMIRACNNYLEMIEGDPSSYLIYLAQLKLELYAQALRLASVRRGLKVARPGDGAFQEQLNPHARPYAS
ncbi:hypothetical protein [Microbacterium sp. Root553]|uniref:hypothetical protein n=1 Tax=Microbacterium sp. Root553 TaxID=1736556 RepID=UPI0012F73166|nr:hypothetical protein [Microbacterium sp. Root553]